MSTFIPSTSELQGGDHFVDALVLLRAAHEEILAAGESGVVLGDDAGVYIHGIGDVDLIEDGDIGVEEDVVVLPDHVVPFRDGDDHDPQVGSEREVGGADEVPDVLDEDDIVVVEVHGLQSLPDEIGVQMAFLAGVAVDGVQPGFLEPSVVVVAGDVSGDGADPDPLGAELLGQLDDEGRLPGSDGAHEVDGPDAVILHHAIVLVGYPVVLLEDVDLGPRLHNMHVPTIGAVRYRDFRFMHVPAFARTAPGLDAVRPRAPDGNTHNIVAHPRRQ